MYLTALTLSNFRCLNQATIQPSPGVNLILGENGAGKTSLLEAIFCLSRGRSFRAKRLQNIIQDDQSAFVIRVKLQEEVERVIAMQVSRGTSSQGSENVNSNFLAKIDGMEIKTRVELNRVLPSILLDPAIHKLIEDGPSLRRQFLDWGVFHVEQYFIAQWRRYQKSLKQRNQGLKQGISEDQLQAWNDILLESGNFIHQARQDYLAHIAGLTQEFASELLNKTVKLSYRPGWAQGMTLKEALEKSQNRERQLGTTMVGPHRADLIIQVGGEIVTTDSGEVEDFKVEDGSELSKTQEDNQKLHRARQRVSRGQQKLIASAMMLAQAEHYKQHSGTAPILLIDDPFAELDNRHAAKLLEKIFKLGGQSFITALNPLDHAIFDHSTKFHVEQGKIIT